MKRFFWKYYPSLLILLFGLCPVYAQTVETLIEFSENDLILSTIDGYDVVEVDSPRSYLEGAEGEPLLPVVTANVVLPAGAEIADAYAVVEAETELAGSFSILPGQTVMPVSSTKKTDFVQPNPAVYNSANLQRVKAVDNATRKIMRGNYLAAIHVYPVDYIPADGTLILRKRIRVYVDYTVDKKNVKKYRPEKNKVFKRMVEESVLNPEAMGADDDPLPAETQMEPLSESDGGGMALMSVPTNVVEYLIITKKEFVDEFLPLADWKTRKGVPAQIVTIEWIKDNYPVSSLQKQIKSCIQDYALNKGTVWVVLGADIDGIPDYNCYTQCNEYTVTDMPTDLYYSDTDVLDWNGNANGYQCELSDGVDMGPDVFVGRISVNTQEQVTAYVNKALSYEKNGPAIDFAQKLLLGGATLWGDIGDVSDAEAKSERMWNELIDPYWWGTRYRFYDTNTDFTGGASYDFNPTNLNEQINAGYNFLHTACHGTRQAWSIETEQYNNDDVALLTNTDKYVNIATIACLSNQFDYIYGNRAPCLGEAFIQKANGGAVSYIGCSRYGWGYSGTSLPGVSLQYNQTFYNYLVSSTYGLHLGEVFARMKESKLPITSYGAMHWVQYGLNLLGDPELHLYIANPQTASPIYDSQIEVGSQTFTVETYPGALVCLFKDNEFYEYGLADGVGIFQVQIAPVNPGIMDVTITCNHFLPYEGLVTIGTVDGEAPAAPTGLTATPAANQVDLDWLDNGEPDFMQYNIYRSLTSTGPYYMIAGGVTGSDYQDVNVYGLTYYYVVTAIDFSRNESSLSTEAAAAPQDTIGPKLPERAVAYGGNGKACVSCNLNTEPDLSHYEIWRKDPGMSEYNLVATPTNNEIPFCDYDVVIGQTYYYYMIAVDVQGNQSPGSAPDDAIPYDAPEPPTNFTATEGNNRVILDWDDNTEPDLWFYVVERSETSGSGYQTIAMLYDLSSYYLDGNVTNGTRYYYVVQAVNTSGQGGGNCEEISALPHPVLVPGPPAAPTSLSGSGSSGRIYLYWKDNADLDTDYYSIYRSTTSGSGYTWIADANDNMYYDYDVELEVPYYYVVTAVDLEDLESGFSNETEEILPDTVAPATPAGLTTFPGDGVVLLDWDNNSEPDLSHYNVYSKTNPSDPWVQINQAPVILSDYTDDTVTNGTDYFYSVTAVDLYDNESGNSSMIAARAQAGGLLVLTSTTFENTALDEKWLNVTDDTDDWTRDSGGTSSSNTGPSSGANTSIWYTYFETSDGYAFDAGDTAILEGPGIYGADRELSFYYHMYGADIGELNVDVYDDGSWIDGIWSLSGQQHSAETDPYTQAIVDLSGYSGLIKVGFRAVAAGGYLGDIALDNIEITGNVTSDPTPPAVPTGLMANAGNQMVSLDWDDNDEGDLICYRVYRSTTPGSGYAAVSNVVPDSSYLDDMVTTGTTYYYVVTAVDTTLNESGTSNEASATPTEPGPPGAPTGLTATPGDNSVILDWDDNTELDLDYYTVYRSTTSGSGYSSIAGGLSFSNHTDDTVVNGTTYYYVVTATNTSAMESDYSSEVFATPGDLTPPAAPTGLVATAGDAAVSLNWNDNGEGDLDGYNIYRSTTSSSGYSQLNSSLLSSSNYFDNSVSNGMTYYYVVTAVDTASNESGYSAEASATPAPPAPEVLSSADFESGFGEWVNVTGDTTDWLRDSGGTPTNKTGPASGANGSTWYVYLETSSGYAYYAGDTAYLEGPDIDGTDRELSFYYHMYGSNIGTLNVDVYDGLWNNGVWSLSGQQHSSSSDPYTQAIVDLSGYTGTIKIRFRAVAAGGYRGDMVIDDIEVTGIIGQDITPPAPPSGLAAVAGDGTVWLDWNDNGEGDLNGYNVYRSTTSGSGYSQLNGSLLSSSDYTDNSVTNGTTYYYVITAVDTSDNESGYSNEDSATPAAPTPPAAPTGLAAMAGDGSVDLDWNDNSEPDLSHYNMYRSTTSGSGYSQIATDVSGSSYDDNTAANGTTYYYVVTAVDTEDSESGFSNEASATPQDATPPAAPTSLSATAGTGTVSLNWNNNGEPDLDSYNVYRSTTSGSGYSQIATDVSSSDYTDNSVANGTTYYYVVTAVDASSNESGFSNEASATPYVPTPPEAPTGLIAIAGDDVVNLDWNDNSEPDLSHYKVYRSTGVGYGQIATNVLVSNYTDNSVTNGIIYYYVVTAVDTLDYESAYSNEAAAMPQDSTPPAPPTGLTATAGDGSVSLDWNNNGEPDLDSYKVYRSTTSGSGYSQIAMNVTNSNYTDNSVTNGTTYYYVVTAVDNSYNESGYSNEDSATPQAGGGEVFADSFEISEWNGLWTEDSQNDWFRSTQRAIDGSRSAEVDGSASDAALTSILIDLQGCSNATVTFSWFIERGLDSGEYLAFDVSTNGGSIWTERARLRGNVDAENTWHNPSIDVTGISSGNLRIRFRGTMSGSNEDADVDDVSVVAW
ncbi:MAG: hypothetical protein JW860_13360 [Sedimentisphaerales bacterium]|nr:hypothetical protein [Sedimentisphaerales bacterium]